MATPARNHVAPLPIFDGKKSEFPIFLRSVRLYVQFNLTNLDTDFKKISFALSYICGGSAGEWADEYTD